MRPTLATADQSTLELAFAIHDFMLVNDSACIQFPLVVRAHDLHWSLSLGLASSYPPVRGAQLVLQPEGNRVRITLDPQSRGRGGAEFETVGVRLDASAQIVEFVLNSLAA